MSDITVSQGSIIINVKLGATIATFPAFVNEDTPIRFDGQAGDTYIIYNSTSKKLQFYVNGVKKFEF